MQVVDRIKINRNVINITSISESDEKEYWLAQTPEKRLEAIEMMRQVAYGYDENSARLQRVLEIAERK
jgi:hypothetical protein